MQLLLERAADGDYQRIELSPGPQRVGRTEHNDVSLRDPRISRVHALLTVSNETVVVDDLGSSNGTRVNDRLVEHGVVATPGDWIEFAGMEFRLLAADSAMSARYPLDELLAPAGEIERVTRLAPEEVDAQSDTVLRTHVEDPKVLRELLPHPHPARSIDQAFRETIDLIRNIEGVSRVLAFLSHGDGFTLSGMWPKGNELPASVMLDGDLIGELVDERVSMHVREGTPSDGPDPALAKHAFLAPLEGKERTDGLLYAELDQEGERSLAVFAVLAHLVAPRIVELSRQLLDQQNRRDLETDKARLEGSITAAAQIQRKLLPGAIPSIPAYDVFADLWPSLETAGDFYDVHTLGDGTTMLAVGDVCGKGLGAALLMSNVISSLRMTYDTDMELTESAARLNRQLVRFTDPDKFTTLFLARLDPHEHEIEYVNAGHNPPFLIPSGGTPVQLRGTGLPIGIAAGAEYRAERIQIEPGMMLCIYTDGIPEAVRGDRFYGEERMLEVLTASQTSLEETVDGIMASMHEYLGHLAPRDDITLMLLQRHRPSE